MTARSGPGRRPARVPVLVVSPHLDDGVLGCGDWLALHPGSVVLTVLAGTPADAAQQTDWDRQCGFADAATALQARRQEDAQALAALQARPVWLPFCDSQYRKPVDAATLAQALADALGALDAPGPDLLLFPLGLFHSDHLLVHDAVRRMLAALPAPPPALAYEDVPYRASPGLLQQRLAALAAAGTQATPARLALPQRPMPAKAAALAAYDSQRAAFGARGWDDAGRPERFWQLVGAPAGEGDAG